MTILVNAAEVLVPVDVDNSDMDFTVRRCAGCGATLYEPRHTVLDCLQELASRIGGKE